MTGNPTSSTISNSSGSGSVSGSPSPGDVAAAPLPGISSTWSLSQRVPEVAEVSRCVATARTRNSGHGVQVAHMPAAWREHRHGGRRHAAVLHICKLCGTSADSRGAWLCCSAHAVACCCTCNRRLLALHALLGGQDDVDVIWMVVREPLLLEVDQNELMRRLMMMKVGARGMAASGCLLRAPAHCPGVGPG